MPTRRATAATHAGEAADGRPGATAARCFVALRPGAAAREQLAALALRLQQGHPGSRAVDRRDLHLTLAFLGALEPAQARQVAELLRGIRAPRFCWKLDRLGGFGRARVLWAGGGEEPRLAALAQAVREGLDALHVGYDPKPFAAHVTLLRGLARAPDPQAGLAIAWMVSAPQLLLSQAPAKGRARYRRWPA